MYKKVMNFRKLFDKITKDGGCSYSPVYGEITKGYAVSPYKDREQQIPLIEFTLTDVRDFYYMNAELLAQPNHFLGCWIDNDIVYLDVSIKESRKINAIKLAKQNKQLAIFDLNNMQTINV